jgi:hypothetical protein
MANKQQLSFDYPEWGGARKGAGRKRATPRPRVEHVSRPRLSNYVPAHVTFRFADGLPTLRQGRLHHVPRKAMAACADRDGFRILHYSAQSNHVHLICEADDARTLARNLQSLCVRLAKGVNRLLGRVGTVFGDRYPCRP